MTRIFISYRRNDTEQFAHLLFDRLNKEPTITDVFLDKEKITAGDKFEQVILQIVRSCDIVLVLIGRKWSRTRLFDPEDWVRREIEEGLKRSPHCSVIPVLVHNAAMPKKSELSDNLKELADIHFFSFRHKLTFTQKIRLFLFGEIDDIPSDPLFAQEAERLIRAIHTQVFNTRERVLPPPNQLWIKVGYALITCVVLALIVLVIASVTKPSDAHSTTTSTPSDIVFLPESVSPTATFTLTDTPTATHTPVRNTRH